MSWTNEEERKKYVSISSIGMLKKEIKGDKCPECIYGLKSGENKHVINFDCGHTHKKIQ